MRNPPTDNLYLDSNFEPDPEILAALHACGFTLTRPPFNWAQTGFYSLFFQRPKTPAQKRRPKNAPRKKRALA